MSDFVDPQILKHNETTLSELERGDLVEFRRFGYSHWGVYIGEEKIVHRTSDENIGSSGMSRCSSKHSSSSSFDKARVVTDNFWNVARSSKAYKNNSQDSNKKPLDPEEIVKNALSKDGEVGYNLLFKNCEHFAKWCRYRVAKSDQADNFIQGAFIAAFILLGLLAVGCTILVNRWLKK